MSLCLNHTCMRSKRCSGTVRVCTSTLRLTGRRRTCGITKCVYTCVTSLCNFESVADRHLRGEGRTDGFFGGTEGCGDCTCTLGSLTYRYALASSFGCAVPLLRGTSSVSRLLRGGSLATSMTGTFKIVCRTRRGCGGTRECFLGTVRANDGRDCGSSVSLLRVCVGSGRLTGTRR